jgi:glutamate transport system permease protein
MSTPVLADDLGPRAKRIVRIASIASGAVILAFIAVALQRLGDRGQLDAEKWRLLWQEEVLKFLWGGLANTLKAASAGMAGAVVLGLALAMLRLANNVVLRWASRLYTEFFRGFPLLLLIIFSFLGLPKLGIEWPRIWYLIAPLIAYNGAVLGEIFRAGILSLDRGQSEAASAIGLGYWEAMFLVIMPQAFRRMTPAIVSQLVVLLKDTSLGFAVSFEELLRRGQITGEFGKNQLQTLTLVAAIYMVVNMSLSQVARRLEVRQRRRYGAGGIQVDGVEDLAVVDAAAGAKL